MNKNLVIKVLVLFSFILSASPSSAENIFERTVKTVAEFRSGSGAEERKGIKPDLRYSVRLPSDLPSHWRLSAFRESVFGGEVLVAEVGDQHKPKVMLVHGLGAAGMRDWLTVVPVLENDYHVLLLDLPGFGSSSTPPGKYSPTNFAHVLAEVKSKYFPEAKVKVVGHSLGGATTLRYAALYPDHMSSIVLVDAAGILERTAFVKHNASLSNILEVSPGKLNQIFHNTKDYGNNLVEILNTFPDPSRLLFTEASWAKVFGNRANINAAFALVQEDFSQAIQQVEVPVSIIWGEEDGVAPLRTGKVLSQNLQNAMLVTIPGAGHVPMKSHVSQFNQYLVQVLTNPNLQPTWSAEYGDLQCKNQQGKTYTGSYDRIVIEGCRDITLLDVKANQILVTDARIQFDDVEIISEGVALSVKDSVVVATNLNINAQYGIVAEKSRIDIAGAMIEAEKSAVSAQEKTRFIFSVSQIRSGYYVGSVHGLYSIENTVLDKRL